MVIYSGVGNVLADSSSQVENPQNLLTTKWNPLPIIIKKEIWDFCINLNQLDAKKLDSEPIHIKLLSMAPEFSLLNGKTSSVIVEHNIYALSCPPSVHVDGTFTSVNGDNHKFKLEYDLNSFRYQIDEIFPSQYHDILQQPLKQFKAGLSIDAIQCSKSMYLIQRYDGKPACVAPNTADVLIQHNWKPIIYAKIDQTLGDQMRGTVKQIRGGTITGEKIDNLTNSVTVSIESRSDGIYTVLFSKSTLKKISINPETAKIFVDGIEEPEIFKREIYNQIEINIPFDENTSKIMITDTD